MRAMLITEFGGPEQLAPAERSDPKPAEGEVLVKVAAAGVNRADVLARAGRYHRAGEPPLQLGLEASGTVIDVGPGVTEVAVGQRVIAMGAINDPGFYAELAAVPAERVVPVPDEVDLVAAAALPTAWLTAWYCLRHLAAVKNGETVVVHAAASGVGSAAVQIAVDAGATVIATAGSEAKTEWALELGATHALNTSVLSAAELLERIKSLSGLQGVEVVLDAVGGETFAYSLHALGYAGRLVALANVAVATSTIDTRDFYPKNARILGFQLNSLIEHGYDPRPDLTDLLQGVASGRFTVPIDATFPLAAAGDAHTYLERRQNRGKVLLTMGDG